MRFEGKMATEEKKEGKEKKVYRRSGYVHSHAVSLPGV